MKKEISLLFVFLFSSTILLQAQWTQTGDDIDGEAVSNFFGSSISLSADGSVIAIGGSWNNDNGPASGHVRIYQNQNGNWNQIGLDIDGEASYDYSGNEVDLSSDGAVVAIGAMGNDGNGSYSGHVRVYQNQNGEWIQIGSDIDGEAEGDHSGRSVCLSSDGTIVAIGAPKNDGNGTDSGHVRIYKNQSGIWTQIGVDIDGEAAGDLSGVSVSLSFDGSILAVGALNNSENGEQAGHVRVYKNTESIWSQIGTDIDGEAASDYSGVSVSLNSDGTVVAIGAWENGGNGYLSGHVRVYQNLNDTWIQIGSDIDGEATWDKSGCAVSLNSDGSVVAIGAPHNDENGADSGHVRIYQNQSSTWTQIGVDINGEEAGDYSGTSVCLNSNGSVVAIGAHYNDGNGQQSGHVRVYNNPYLSVSTILDTNVSVYPIPTENILFIKGDAIQKIEVMDILGRNINTYKDTNKINLTKNGKGIYFLRIYTIEGVGERKVIVK